MVLEKNWAVSYETKHIITIGPTNCTPGNLSQRNENGCSHKNLYMNVYNSFICSSHETEQDPMGLLGTKAFLCPLP